MAAVDVYINREQVGRLEKNVEKHIFSYHQNAPEALSLTMPLRAESYSFTDLHPLFQMNLPEGYLRQAIERATAKQYGSDDLTMLALLGPNQIGRLAYALAEQPLALVADTLPDLQTLLGSEDATLFDQLLNRFATQSGVAGVQPKVLLDIAQKEPPLASKNPVSGKLSLPLQSYIVKSWGPEYPELACNEYVCLSLAKNAGLQMPEFHLSDNGKLLISKRFDLNEQGTSQGFEDFCVLQAKGTREKYDASLESCAHTIKQFVSAEYQAQALYDFFKLTLINIKIKNGDAHLKNSGVIYSNLSQYKLGEMPRAGRKLAPIFDIVSTAAYIKNDTMALTLGGTKRWPKYKALQQFAKLHCSLNTKKMNRAIDEVEQASETTYALLNRLNEQHPNFSPIANTIRELMEQPLD